MQDDEPTSHAITDRVVAWISTYDEYEANRKPRPVVVVQVNDHFAAVLGITTSFDKSKDKYIVLPHGKNCMTGLTKPSAVNCEWLQKVPLGDCRKVGEVPPKLMGPIVERLRAAMPQINKAKDEYRAKSRQSRDL